MKVNLVYIVNGQEIILETMDLEKLDQFTYSKFDSEEDVIKSTEYKKLLEDLPRTGDVKIAFDTIEVPLHSVEYFAEFGFDPFKRKVHYLDVLVNDRKIAPTVVGIRECIINTLCDVSVADEFYRMFKDKYTPKELIFYHAGMLNGNDELVFDGIKRIINDTTDNKNGYFAGRMFLHGLSKFDSIKNKNEKGKIVSPKIYIKNK